jgi:hypothetical protein
MNFSQMSSLDFSKLGNMVYPIRQSYYMDSTDGGSYPNDRPNECDQLPHSNSSLAVKRFEEIDVLRSRYVSSSEDMDSP